MVFNYAFYILYGYYVEYRAINMEKQKKVKGAVPP